MGKIISLSISIAYLVVAYLYGGNVLFLGVLFFIILSLACIWFSDEMGGYHWGLMGCGGPTRETPGSFVKFGGWILLLFIGAMLFLMIRFKAK